MASAQSFIRLLMGVREAISGQRLWYTNAELQAAGRVTHPHAGLDLDGPAPRSGPEPSVFVLLRFLQILREALRTAWLRCRQHSTRPGGPFAPARPPPPAFTQRLLLEPRVSRTRGCPRNPQTPGLQSRSPPGRKHELEYHHIMLLWMQLGEHAQTQLICYQQCCCACLLPFVSALCTYS